MPAGAIVEQKQIRNGIDRPITIYVKPPEDDAQPATPAVPEQTEPVTTISDAGYTVTFSGGPPEIELPGSNKFLDDKEKPTDRLPGHSENKTTARRGGASNSHSGRVRRPRG